ncbi:glutathione S-transferase family protein [Jannaschia formosa]|uniref:glutathione S-transferase family protein n=1 Tax=Jannaschia formosa TaxID=2259592 RepID=UPI000E1C03F2|nr:glutathione S-transferase family protein [Jannaschia formosa]TFL18752.1 glutathione S-transferase family protein [Jannaschia formosa]
MLKLYGVVKSRAMRPLWLLEELGEPFEWVPAGPQSEGVRAVSPLGKVPVLVTDEGPIFDSVAQMTWLADRAGRFTHPAGSYQRARQDGLTNTINETFDAVLWAYAKHSFVLPEERRVPEVKESLRWQFGRYAAVMAELIEGPCVMGEEPLIPDFLLAHCCGWAAGLKFDLPEGLRAHMNAMRARPAFRRALARE